MAIPSAEHFWLIIDDYSREKTEQNTIIHIK